MWTLVATIYMITNDYIITWLILIFKYMTCYNQKVTLNYHKVTFAILGYFK